MKKYYLRPSMAVEYLGLEQIIATSDFQHIIIDRDETGDPEEADCPVFNQKSIFD